MAEITKLDRLRRAYKINEGLIGELRKLENGLEGIRLTETMSAKTDIFLARIRIESRQDALMSKIRIEEAYEAGRRAYHDTLRSNVQMSGSDAGVEEIPQRGRQISGGGEGTGRELPNV